jgi:phosphatidylglycerol:prolipoprotein diacylglycerol transferase
MYPELFRIGPFPIHTYGVLVAIGFLVAVQVIKKLAAMSKLPVEKVLDLTFWCLLVGFIGARVLFVLTRWQDFAADPLAVFKVWEGGLVFFGGPIAAVPFAIYYLKKHQMNLWAVMDSMIPGLVIAHAFGRLGCIAAGCCYGKPTGGDWGFVFHSELVDVTLRGVHLHPVQLYESLALVVLFFGLLSLYKRKSFDGHVTLFYFMIYPIIRSIVEIYRGDQIRGFVIDNILSTSQFISILVFGVSALLLVKRLKQVKT